MLTVQIVLGIRWTSVWLASPKSVKDNPLRLAQPGFSSFLVHLEPGHRVTLIQSV